MVFIKLMIIIANAYYALIKWLYPQKNLIVFLSRQSNEPSIDFRLLFDMLDQKDVYYQYNCQKLSKNIWDNIINFNHQIILCAQASIIIIDSYVIPVSILKHRSDVKVIQMWHALGAIKQFGYQTLDKVDGSNSKLAKVMHMHENYDYILASTDNIISDFSLAFNQPTDKFIKVGLPHIDILTGIKDPRIMIEYPHFNDYKPVVLYAPTFRKHRSLTIAQNLIDNFDYQNYHLIVKLHPSDQTQIVANQATLDYQFDTIYWINTCDIFVSDYSACIFDAVIANKKVFLYVPDIQDYQSTCGLNIDVREYFPQIEVGGGKKMVFNDNDGISEAFKEKYCLTSFNKTQFMAIIDLAERG